MSCELKKINVQSILVLEYKKRNDHKVFHSSIKLTGNDSGTDKAFKSMHQSIMTKIKNSASKDWAAEIIIKHNNKIFECYYRRKK